MNIVKLHKIKGNLNATGVSHRFYRVPCFALKEKIGISVEICGSGIKIWSLMALQCKTRTIKIAKYKFKLK